MNKTLQILATNSFSVGVSLTLTLLTTNSAEAFNPKDLEQLIETNDCRFCDLRDADLSGSDLSGAILSGADLSDANLAEANLSNAKLIDAQLIGTNLSGANLIGANLTKALLSHANLLNADLSDANLILANLEDADLTGANLTGTNWISATNITESQLSFASQLDKITLPDESQPTFCQGEETLNGSTGSLSSQNGFPFVQNYSTCSWLIQTPEPMNAVALEIPDLLLKDTVLEFFDGNNSTNLLASVTGEVDSETLMFPVESLLVRYSVDFSPNTSGVELSYAGIEISSPDPTTSVPEPSSAIGFGLLALSGWMGRKRSQQIAGIAPRAREQAIGNRQQ
ncbi:pentapeptide repeat-containing protein [Coleofasciculus sp. E2-BRE-01]|uniref:pentapeptide repeat-containing protein n=1 Tax=Coleofasciculus sp. E2-BRE-01 TaxID=3069524 RepID=UPI0032F8C929